MGLPQSDLILIKALREGINYIRQFPWHLDYIFQDVTQDLVNQEFGKKEIDAAKKWFLNTNIPVLSAYRIDRTIYPCVVVQVKSSNEDKSRSGLGESDSDVFNEEVDANQFMSSPRISLGPFTPSYDLVTGNITLPAGFDNSLVFPGQGLTSPSTGNNYIIKSIIANGFTIDAGVRDNFTNAYVIPAYNTLHVTRRRTNFAETYEVACYVSGATGELYWLHSLISYILLQRRQYLFEKYNIGLSTISSGPISKEIDDTTENFFTRPINIEANVEVSWVDSVEEKIEGVIPIITLV